MKTAILVDNQYTDRYWTDPRVQKKARALIESGHDVCVFATGKYGQHQPMHETNDGIRIVRRPTLLHQLHRRVRPADPATELGSSKRQACYQCDDDYTRPLPRLRERALRLLHELNTMFLYSLAILPAAIRFRADVYVGSGLHALLPAYLAARRVGAKLVYDSSELWLDMHPIPLGPLHRRFLSRLEGTMCRRADLVIATTDSMGQVLVERYGIAPPLVIPNVHPFQTPAFSPQLRGEMAGPDTEHVAVFVGLLNPGRGLEVLVDAAQYLDDSFVIAVLGDGAIRQSVQARIAEKDVGSRIRLLGWIPPDEILAYVASADVGISPMSPSPNSCLNNYYSIDNKSYYYVMAGIPLAVSNQPEKRLLVEKYGIGQVFDEANPRELAQTLRDLVADPLRYQQMRANCLKAARAELNWETFAAQFVDAVNRLDDGADQRATRRCAGEGSA